MASATKMVIAMVAALLFVTLADAKYQEMTHVMDQDNMVFHPVYADNKYHFVYDRDQAGPSGNLDFVAWSIFKIAEHMGTHMDAPYHFDPDGRHPAEIPLSELHGPLVRIDIREKAKTNKRATVDISDLQAWEERNGQIPPKAFILMDSGWSQYWGDQAMFVGTDTLQEPEKLNWPGFHIDAVKWLLENRDFLGLGTDTLSCDIPPDNEVHKAILIKPQSKVCLENLNFNNEVPECGAMFYYTPLLMKEATGGQIRAYAHWDDHMEGCKDGKPKIRPWQEHVSGAKSWQANLFLVATLLSLLLAIF